MCATSSGRCGAPTARRAPSESVVRFSPKHAARAERLSHLRWQALVGHGPPRLFALEPIVVLLRKDGYDRLSVDQQNDASAVERDLVFQIRPAALGLLDLDVDLHAGH